MILVDIAPNVSVFDAGRQHPESQNYWEDVARQIDLELEACRKGFWSADAWWDADREACGRAWFDLG